MGGGCSVSQCIVALHWIDSPSVNISDLPA